MVSIFNLGFRKLPNLMLLFLAPSINVDLPDDDLSNEPRRRTGKTLGTLAQVN